ALDRTRESRSRFGAHTRKSWRSCMGGSANAGTGTAGSTVIVVSPHRTAPAALGEALVPADGTGHQPLEEATE
ncbi:MAG TPA: hypothetical protein VJT72_11910, partial [Pseudonocardiaceae bacterium]|nr:hypothetical protein [Pseudonocardiaceae bacterium]